MNFVTVERGLANFGFLIAFFQIFSQKKTNYSLKSKLRRIQLELNSLRNQSIEDDDMEIVDEINDSIS